MNDNDPCWPCEEQVIEKLPPCPLQCRSKKCKSYKRSFEGKPIVWVVGGPTCGKSTQCQKINAKYGFLHLSVGGLLRKEVASQSVRGKCLAKTMQRGEKVPYDLKVDLLKTAILESLEHAKGFLVDGFPEEKKQGLAFEKQIAPCSVVLYLEVSPATMNKRLGSSVDDQANKENLKLFYENNELLLAQYSNKLHSINAERSADEVFRDVSLILDSLISTKAA